MYKNLAYIFPDPASGPRDAELAKIDAYLKEQVPSSKIVDKYEEKELPWLPEQPPKRGGVRDILYEAKKLLERVLKEGGESESFVESLKRFVSLIKINEDNLIQAESREIIEDNYRATGKIPGCGRNTLYVRCDSRVDTVVGYYVNTFNAYMDRVFEAGAEYHAHVCMGNEYKLEYRGKNRWD